MSAGLQDHDIVARRRTDGGYELTQVLRGDFILLLDRSLTREEAEARALEAAEREQSDAWIEEAPGVYRCLNV